MDAFDTTTARGARHREFVDDPLQLVTSAGSRRALLGGRRRRLRHASRRHCSPSRSWSPPSPPFIADGSSTDKPRTGNRGPRCISPTGPEPGARDIGPRARDDGGGARRCASASSARAAAKVKLRQPLKEAVIVAVGREREGIERPGRHRARPAQRQAAALRPGPPTSSLLRRQAQLPRASGPRFGKRMRQVARLAWRRSTRPHVAGALREGRTIGIASRRPTTTSSARTTWCWADGAARGLPAGARGLATRGAPSSPSTTSCGREGARARRGSSTPSRTGAQGRGPGRRGPQSGSCSAATTSSSGRRQAHEEYLAREVLAVEIAYDGSLDGHVATIEDRELRIGVARRVAPAEPPLHPRRAFAPRPARFRHASAQRLCQFTRAGPDRARARVAGRRH